MRLGLWFLALAALVPGLWAYLAPRSFFDGFPGAGAGWVSLHPPYNEHLVKDAGAFFAAFGLLFILAALWKRRALTVAALTSWLVFAAAHFGFHITNLEGEGSALVGQLVALGVMVGVPLMLLPAVRKTERSSY